MSGMAMTPPSLGARIRRARERRQLSQEDLARAVGASVRAVGDWENNRRKPRNRLGALEEVLGVSLDGEPEPEPAIPKSLLRDIMQAEGLTDGERHAVIAAVERTLRGEPAAPPPPAGGASGAAPGHAGPERRRPAS
jgi:transcriptional regulator with XRE-family HTH domain